MTQYIDYLQEYMRRLAKRYVEEHADNFPAEFMGLPNDRLIELLVDHSMPILRKIEDDALAAAIHHTCSMLRFAQKQKEEK
jgi:hypothetical protein